MNENLGATASEQLSLSCDRQFPYSRCNPYETSHQFYNCCILIQERSQIL
ncbi:MAG: hypothetical protein F6J93_32040 [Oscillatoria sp. SIO1A7]|nr:hypothetical protein [Oscillatoria sp. SIO1A7]